jgi:hypothetical protein
MAGAVEAALAKAKGEMPAQLLRIDLYRSDRQNVAVFRDSVSSWLWPLVLGPTAQQVCFPAKEIRIMWTKLFRSWHAAFYPRPARKPLRLTIEVLEDRMTPATIDWTALGGGSFGVDANWTVRGTSIHRTPAIGDNAFIDRPNDVIMFTESHEVNSLTATVQLFQMSGSGTTLTLDGLLPGDSSSINHLLLGANTTLQVAGNTTSLTSGSSIAGTVNVSPGATLAFASGVQSVSINNGSALIGQGHYRLNGGTLSVGDGVNATAPADFGLTGGALAGPGTFNIPSAIIASWSGGEIDGPTTVAAGGTLNITGGSRKDFNGANFTNNGVVTWMGTGDIHAGNGAVLNNNNTWTIQNNQQLVNDYGNPVTFTNTGTLRKSGSGATLDTAIQLIFNNNGGTIDVQSGNLFLPGGTSTGGAYNVAAGSFLDLTSGQTQNISGTFTGAGNGTVRLSGGTLNVLAAGATLNFPGALFQWTGGQFLGNVTTATLTNGNTLNISDGSRKDFNGLVFNNPNTVNWSGNGELHTGNGAVLNNGGTWTIQNDQRFINDYGNAVVFNNTGTLRKSAGTLDSAINLVFNNNGGTVEVLSGNLFLPGGTSTGGTYNVAGGSLLDLTSGQTQNYSGTYTGTGGGIVQLSGGTLNLEGGANFNFAGPAVQWIGGQLTSDVLGATLTNRSIWNITGGSRKDFNGVTFTNTGTINWSGMGDIHAGNGATVTNSGTWNIQNDQGMIWDYGVTTGFNNTGTITKSAGDITRATPITLVFNNTGTGLVNLNSGVLQLGAGSMDSGTFNASAGTFLQFSGGTHVLSTGTVLPSDGTTQVTGGATVIVTDVIAVQTFGVTNGTLQMTSTGILNVGGNYDQTANGSLVVAIGGTTAGAGFGQVNVTGTAFLAGSFSAVLVNDFAPDIGQSFPVLTYGARDGSFNNVNLPGLPPDRRWDTNNEYGANAFTLTVIPA